MREFYENTQVARRLSCVSFLHKYEVVAQTPVTKYKQCERCAARMAVTTNDVHQPVNLDWVNCRTNDHPLGLN